MNNTSDAAMARYGIPEHCRDGLRRYLVNKIPPGSFLTAVLENDLLGALEAADHINECAVKNYLTYLVCEAPRNTWGSPEIVRKWLLSEEKVS